MDEGDVRLGQVVPVAEFLPISSVPERGQAVRPIAVGGCPEKAAPDQGRPPAQVHLRHAAVLAGAVRGSCQDRLSGFGCIAGLCFC